MGGSASAGMKSRSAAGILVAWCLLVPRSLSAQAVPGAEVSAKADPLLEPVVLAAAEEAPQPSPAERRGFRFEDPGSQKNGGTGRTANRFFSMFTYVW